MPATITSPCCRVDRSWIGDARPTGAHGGVSRALKPTKSASAILRNARSLAEKVRLPRDRRRNRSTHRRRRGRGARIRLSFQAGPRTRWWPCKIASPGADPTWPYGAIAFSISRLWSWAHSWLPDQASALGASVTFRISRPGRVRPSISTTCWTMTPGRTLQGREILRIQCPVLSGSAHHKINRMAHFEFVIPTNRHRLIPTNSPFSFSPPISFALRSWAKKCKCRRSIA